MSVGGRGPKPDIDEMCVAWHELRSPSRGREAAPRLRAFTPPSATCFLSLSLSLRGSGLAQGLHPSPSATCLLSLSLSRYSAQGWLRAFTPPSATPALPDSPGLPFPPAPGGGHPSPGEPQPSESRRTAAIRVPANCSHPSPGETRPSESRRTAAIRVPEPELSPSEPQATAGLSAASRLAAPRAELRHSFSGCISGWHLHGFSGCISSWPRVNAASRPPHRPTKCPAHGRPTSPGRSVLGRTGLDIPLCLIPPLSFPPIRRLGRPTRIGHSPLSDSPSLVPPNPPTRTADSDWTFPSV